MKNLFVKIYLIVFIAINLHAEEGMYPLSEIKKLNLNELGFNISADELYNTNGVSLITALVNLSGCTGSFISENGLILTNHHCSFSAVSRASTLENNYLENGFSATNFSEEIEAKGITAKIIESYKDVSEEILESIKDIKNDADRRKGIDDKIKEITQRETDTENYITASVAEMLPGKSYVLFLYKTIYDVRIVYAPPLSIGNFGGEEDNWVWPRHTGDFTFLRAYVSPEGKSTKYSEENIPYKPKRWLNINTNGIKENDFAFILGYPGRTFRHQPVEYLKYQNSYLLPLVSELYGWLINQYEDLSSNNDSLKLVYAPIIKGLANTYKNFNGKLLGIKRLNLIEKKTKEENKVMDFIKLNKPKEEFKDLKNMFEEIYSSKYKYAAGEIVVDRLLKSSNIYNCLDFLLNYKTEIAKPDKERQQAFQEKNLDKSLNSFYSSFNKININLEKRIFVKALEKFNDFGENYGIFNYLSYKLTKKENAKNFIDRVLNNSVFLKEGDKFVDKSVDELLKLDDSLIVVCSAIKDYREAVRTENESFEGANSRLLPLLVDAKMEMENKKFIPDANGTLRLTFGRVIGYSPADATYYKPFTTLSGVIDKSYRGEDYKIPEKLIELNKIKDQDKFFSKDLNDIPVAFLYNMDTTGGNSGSPVLNSYGELIGLNFDRAFEATINDFAWSSDYSRSIGVDIRYILYITKNLGNAKHLLKELNID